jgi:hypothetical protein
MVNGLRVPPGSGAAVLIGVWSTDSTPIMTPGVRTEYFNFIVGFSPPGLSRCVKATQVENPGFTPLMEHTMSRVIAERLMEVSVLLSWSSPCGRYLFDLGTKFAIANNGGSILIAWLGRSLHLTKRSRPPLIDCDQAPLMEQQS